MITKATAASVAHLSKLRSIQGVICTITIRKTRSPSHYEKGLLDILGVNLTVATKIVVFGVEMLLSGACILMFPYCIFLSNLSLLSRGL